MKCIFHQWHFSWASNLSTHLSLQQLYWTCMKWKKCLELNKFNYYVLKLFPQFYLSFSFVLIHVPRMLMYLSIFYSFNYKVIQINFWNVLKVNETIYMCKECALRRNTFLHKIHEISRFLYYHCTKSRNLNTYVMKTSIRNPATRNFTTLNLKSY